MTERVRGEGRPEGAEGVRAAGGVLRRRDAGGGLEVVLVHRPAYDDWSFPKGKLLDGEEDEAAALREVLEETGIVCRLEEYLGGLSYRDRKGRPKTVRYWVMTPMDGLFVPNAEIDELRWLPVADAAALLSYAHDRTLLDRLVGVERPSADAAEGSVS